MSKRSISYKSSRWFHDEALCSQLSPFGERLRQTWLKTETPISTWCEKLGISHSTLEAQLKAQLGKKTVSMDEPDGSVPGLKQIMLYARSAEVSIAWLLTGLGDQDHSPYGPREGDASVFSEYCEGLRRAAKALMELERYSPTKMRHVVELADRKFGESGKDQSAQWWLRTLQDELVKQQSGVYESTKSRTAKALK